ncbi:hypothetical protein JCM6882_008798 [Rhodosporidiobolus microsporus]
MAYLEDKQYSTHFSGLKSTAITAGAFIAGGIIIHETLKRLRCYPDEDRRRKAGDKTVPVRGMEGWAMGYLYRARTFVVGEKTPDYPSYPLSWAVEAYKLDESFFERHCGPDATVYVRFIRGCFFWITAHLFTTFPILLSINFIYAPEDVSVNSLERASMRSLVESGSRGLYLLPVHVVFVWLIVLSWIGNLFWIGYGALRIRRNELRGLLRDEAERYQPDPKRSPDHSFSPHLDPSVSQKDLGWRYRTVLVRNIPPALRSEEAVAGYFQQLLRSRGPSEDDAEVHLEPPTPTSGSPLKKYDLPLHDRKDGRASPPKDKFIADIVLVRRHAEVNELFAKYGEVLHQLETAHVELARNAIAWVAKKVEQQEAERTGVPLGRSPWEWWKERLRTKKRREKDDLENAPREGDDLLVSTLRPFLPQASSPSSPSDVDVDVPDSLWTALHDLHAAHPTLLDRFQPLYRLRMFRQARVPAIDYYLAKHNLLYALIEDKRAHADTDFEPASTAFVTFEKASDARRARKELKWRPLKSVYRGRVLDFKVSKAPEVRDLHFDRLVLTSLSSDLLRSTILQTLIWAATLFWVLPISFLIGLLSLDSLTDHLPGLAAFLERNPVANSIFTSLLPTAIMAILNMFVPTVLGILQRKGRTLITESKWSLQTQAVYWKFVVINLIIIFCIGATAFTAFLNAFKQPTSVLPVVAAAFPKGATFFTSYILLQAGIHTGVEISLLGISWINHGSIRKYIAPRKRAIESIPRFFGFQSWVPNHLFVTSICLLFAVLNPLVIAFGWIYFCIAVIVFKQQFAHVYYRRHFENGGRLVYRRVFRYSLDMCVLSEFVFVAFFAVVKRFSLMGAIIPLLPITVATKIIGTRWFDHLMDEVEEAQIDVICSEGDAAAELSVPLTAEDRNLHHLTFAEAVSTIKTFATVTLPSLALRPAAKLPRVANPSKLTSHWKTRSEAVVQPKRPRTSSRSNSFSSRPRPRASTSPDDWSRPMLETIMSREDNGANEDNGFARMSPSPSQDRYGNWAAASDEGHEAPTQPSIDEKLRVVPAPAPAAIFEEALKAPLPPSPSSHTRVSSSSSILFSHPPIVRDDRPVSHLHYSNPAITTPLSRTLWLPRDPLKPVDLGDTVDYHGRALVSSEGGRGIVGSWVDETTKGESEDEEQPVEKEQGATAMGEVDVLQGEGGARKEPPRTSDEVLLSPSSPAPSAVAAGSPALARRSSRISIIDLDRRYTLRGNERIRVAADVAAKIEAEEGGRQLSVLDASGLGRRRGSSSASQRSSSIFSGLQRRGTHASSIGPRSPSMSHSPHHSPVLVRHPAESRPSPPAIPVFTDEPAPLEAAPPSGEAGAYPFPPTSPTPARRNTGASLQLPPSPTHTRTLGRSPSVLSTPHTPSRPSSSGGPTSPTSPTSNRYPPLSPTTIRTTPRRPSGGDLARNRSLRSPSIAPSIQFSTVLGRMSEEGGGGPDAQEILVHPDVEDETGAPAVSLSQSAAVRAELLEEARKAHEVHAKREKAQLEQERRDREGGGGAGWFRRMVVRTEAEAEVDET